MIRRLLICCLLFLGLATASAAVLYISRDWWLDRMGRWLVVDQQPVEVDAIVAVSGENRRRRYAIELFGRGYSDRLIFNVSDTTYYFGEPIDPVASVMEYLERAGVPADRAVFNRDVSSTWEDAHATLETARRYGIRSLIVVSDPFNMRRVKMTYDRVLTPAEVSVTYCCVPLEWEKIELDHWWTREREFLEVYNEYLKILYYLFKYFL